MIEVERVDYLRVPVRDIEKATHFYGEICTGAGLSDPDGNRILLHHRYAPYPDGSRP